MRNENGNVFIYILIGIVLLAALNAIVSRSGESNGSSQRLSEAKRSLLADEIMLHASAAEQAVRGMQTTGTDMSFNPPSVDDDAEDDFYIAKRRDDSGNLIAEWDDRPLHNLLHPKGGGLQHKGEDDYQGSLFDSSATTKGWLYQTKRNVTWSKSSANDIMIALSGINQQVCEEINNRIRDDKTIFSTSTSASQLFDEETSSTSDTDICGNCEDHPSLCIEADGDNVYYNILISN